ncbi:MAG: hypothetical protein P8130_07600 [Deltaproteobacteria bacterium]
MNEISNDGKETKTRPVKNYLGLVVLSLVYLLCALRYFPGRPVDTLLATVEHILASVPFAVGLTLVFVSLFTKTAGRRPSKLFLARLFLTISICIEFFYGLYNYLATGG